MFDPSMITEDEATIGEVLPSIKDIAPNIIDELKEDFVLHKKVYTTRKGQEEIWFVGLKG